MNPYYADESVTLYHGDCREVDAWLAADVLVTDPPYGIAYNSGSRREKLAASIVGDEDTSLRDWALETWGRSALVFGTWRIPRPAGTHTRLIWDTKGALGMGNLAVPWKPSDQEVYVIGYDFAGRRDSNVLRHAPVQSMAKNGRTHPHEKPLSLMTELIAKTSGTVADPVRGLRLDVGRREDARPSCDRRGGRRAVLRGHRSTSGAGSPRLRRCGMTGSHRTSLRQIRKACAAEGHHWQSWDRWINYCTHCGLRRPT